MKILRKAIAAAAVLTLCLSLGLSALADDGDDALYAGKTWEQVVDQVLEEVRCVARPDHRRVLQPRHWGRSTTQTAMNTRPPPVCTSSAQYVFH